MRLKRGVYENIIDEQLKADMEAAETAGLVCETMDADSAELPKILAEHIAQAIQSKLTDEGNDNNSKVDYINKLLECAGMQVRGLVPGRGTLLSSVITKQEAVVSRNTTASSLIRPLTGFRTSNLFTGGQEGLSLGEEMGRDIASADNICMIVSFLKLSGVRMMMDKLKAFCSKDGHTLRVITTTYCGVTEARAVEQLSKLPNTEIRISYNTSIERLHAKAYIFLRNSGLSTAYIGSSNLSRSAQTDGLEWNVRVTNVENPHIIKSAMATFEMYWESSNFEDFRIGGVEKFMRESGSQRASSSNNITLYQKYSLLPYQKQILDKLEVERKVNNVRRNLVVAATGTGKTVISAFDYKRFKDTHERSRLLFIAHREEILGQARRTYRSVLMDYDFGELWVGSNKPQKNLDHLFVSIQTFNSKKDDFSALGDSYYDYIVIDEAHHSTADSYRALFKMFNPQILLGLTATPERMDGKSLLPDFCDRISAEIRLPQALSEGLLTPFQYLCITDSVDLSDTSLWGANKYDVAKLSARLCDAERASLIIMKLRQYLPDEDSCKALCFCTDKKHATFMADAFTKAGLRAAALTSDTREEDRRTFNRQLANGELNYLFVVDIFNEGVDIPEVDTALFLRPTESLTIFLQQLGRGLRLAVGKQYLTVLDFVAQANKNYDFTSRFRALMTRSDRAVRDQVATGFTMLPPGCSIYMEEKAQQYILQNINGAIYNKRRIVREIAGYDHTPTLGEFLTVNGQDIRIIYRGNACWTSLKREAQKCEQYKDDEYTTLFTKGMGALVHVNSTKYIQFIRHFLNNNCNISPTDDVERKYALMLYYSLFQSRLDTNRYETIYDALRTLASYPLFMQEMREICDYLLDNLEFSTADLGGDYKGLEVHGCYSKDEIFILFGKQTEDRTMQGFAMGVYRVEELNTELFFVTLNKSDRDFSPSTQYDDYFISDKRFHWQSQGTDGHAGSGQRFVEQRTTGRRFILFVREDKKDGYGNTSPFYCMGLLDYIHSSGDFPMNIEWSMHTPALPRFIKAV